MFDRTFWCQKSCWALLFTAVLTVAFQCPSVAEPTDVIWPATRPADFHIHSTNSGFGAASTLDIGPSGGQYHEEHKSAKFPVTITELDKLYETLRSRHLERIQTFNQSEWNIDSLTAAWNDTCVELPLSGSGRALNVRSDWNVIQSELQDLLAKKLQIYGGTINFATDSCGIGTDLLIIGDSPPHNLKVTNQAIVDRLWPGDYEILISQPGKTLRSTHVTVPPDATLDIHISDSSITVSTKVRSVNAQRVSLVPANAAASCEEFMTAMTAGDWEGAYKYFSSNFQGKFPYHPLSSYRDSCPTLLTKCWTVKIQEHGDSANGSIMVTCRLSNDENSGNLLIYELKIKMVKEHGDWRIDRYR